MTGLSLEVLGAGAVSAAGVGLPSHLDASPAGEERVDRFERAEIEGVDGAVCLCKAEAVDVRRLLKSPKTRKFLTREMQLLLVAADELRSCLPAVEPERVGVVLATAPALSSMPEIAGIKEHCVVDGQLVPALLGENLSLVIPATWPLRCLKATAACHLAAEFGWVGPNVTLSPRSSASLNGLLICDLLLQSGAADVVIAAGSDSRTDKTSAAEAVTRRLRRLGVERVPASSLEPGFSEGAGAVALARAGDGGDADRVRIVSYGCSEYPQEVPRAAARSFRELLDCVRDGRPVGEVWLDVHPDLVPGEEALAALGEVAAAHGTLIDVQRLNGNLGIAGASLALASACGRLAAGAPGSEAGTVVASVGRGEMVAVLLERGR